MNGCLPTGEAVPWVWSPAILQYHTVEGRSVEAPRSVGGVMEPRMQASCPPPPPCLVHLSVADGLWAPPSAHLASRHKASREPKRHCPFPHEPCSFSGESKINTSEENNGKFCKHLLNEWMNKWCTYYVLHKENVSKAELSVTFGATSFSSLESSTALHPSEGMVCGQKKHQLIISTKYWTSHVLRE